LKKEKHFSLPSPRSPPFGPLQAQLADAQTLVLIWSTFPHPNWAGPAAWRAGSKTRRHSLPLFFFTTESRVATVGTGGFRRRTRLRWPRRDSTPIQKPVLSHGAVQRGPRLAETVWPRKPETVAGIALVAVRGRQRRLSGGGRKERFWIAELVAAWLGVSFRRAERAGGGSGSASAAMADGRGGNGGRERFRLARRAIHGGAQGADEAMHASY
jgi:hypothetical protein